MTKELDNPALLTDFYELSMAAAALKAGAADKKAAFELFARRLPEGRSYGVVGGVNRVLELVNRHWRQSSSSSSQQ